MGWFRGLGGVLGGFQAPGRAPSVLRYPSVVRLMHYSDSESLRLIQGALNKKKGGDRVMPKRNLPRYFLVCAVVMIFHFLLPGLLVAEEPAKIVQAQAILTVSESKRLIAKAVKEMPIVKNALTNGMVIIVKGTTN